MNDKPEWIKASASTASGDCVEMRAMDGSVQVRDSKNPRGAVLTVSRDEFGAWLRAAQHQEFDGLV
ncbi:DUF397 domain-containing protein [Kineosporia sp. J2-2]|uniref:DUF397 domain-containing protein n=1 Tax=Kineosporia corallincola TaxID=2835133 RepID=A0ABS5TF59_9ACTN|nr:DUF397 domain-containing protein [Kineosporia corallincola]MBT0769478.1 DUF397 domain-containing protein [Kineosporia corallincola]